MSQQYPSIIQPAHPPADFGNDLPHWLVQQGKTNDLLWLLAHADDGVIWGRIDGDTLTLSSEIAVGVTPQLRIETLQQLRLFGPTGELYLWLGEGGWLGRLIDDNTADTQPSYETQYLLWGNLEEQRNERFVLLADGVEGLRHAPPLPKDKVFDAERAYLVLSVRHYLAYDDDGQAYVAASRLVDLDVAPRERSRTNESGA